MNDDPDSSRSRGAQPEGAGSATPSADTEIAILVEHAAWPAAVPESAALARRAAAATLAAAGPAVAAGVELSVVLADDALLRRLNREYRGRDRATNVLAFAAEETIGEGQAGPVMLGDVVISLDTLRREATAQGKTPAQHLCHLTVHGVLHLLGYDHRDAAEATRMETLETRILAGLGVPDPYEFAVAEHPPETAAP